MNIYYDGVDKMWYVTALVDHQNADGTWGAHTEIVAEFNTRQEAEDYCSVETE